MQAKTAFVPSTAQQIPLATLFGTNSVPKRTIKLGWNPERFSIRSRWLLQELMNFLLANLRPDRKQHADLPHLRFAQRKRQVTRHTCQANAISNLPICFAGRIIRHAMSFEQLRWLGVDAFRYRRLSLTWQSMTNRASVREMRAPAW